MPNRRNIIITRDKNYKKEGIEVAHSLEEALSLVPHKKEEIFIIGGEGIFREAMDIADRLYITHINATDKDANVFFPEIIPIVWNETSHIEHKKDKDNPHDYTFSIYEKFI